MTPLTEFGALPIPHTNSVMVICAGARKSYECLFGYIAHTQSTYDAVPQSRQKTNKFSIEHFDDYRLLLCDL